ncbi:MAG: transcriptional repressor LexA [Clostridiales bacterium]|jgi:repressor LexA|nr:transcriptional repressor LexA [Clostridiales bacterium]MDD2572226.1 transcriptional repressor LexA [Eubacteriales bacterium]MDY0119387.1 transcriptional repressor LexA [Clostridia bacterium]NLG30607.1 transcriptional repressor LexA [Clostridiaceae bacterium]MCK9349625.1 transcriptional repressor LexA [Clostridiales bacterium]
MESKETYPFTRANVDETLEAVYDFICEYIRHYSYAPSVRDIGEGTGLRSTSTVYSHLKRLAAEGRIEMEMGKRRSIRVPELDAEQTPSIPLVGTVTAGRPILATENIERMIPLPFPVRQDPDSVFALRVEGDSMVGASILDGDIVIIEKQSIADDGEIVVALLGDEATVKTLKRHAKGQYYLHPENDRYDDIPLDREDSMILGVVRGLLRMDI